MKNSFLYGVVGLLLALGCNTVSGSDEVYYEDGFGTISEEGGVVADDNGTVIDIPSGALSEDVEISVVQTAEQVAAEQELKQHSSIQEFLPAGTKFSTPISVTLSYDPSGVDGDESQLQIWWTDDLDGAWEAIASTVDTDAHTVTAMVSHFSYGFVGVKDTEPETDTDTGGGGPDMPICGNGIAEDTEECDGADMGGSSGADVCSWAEYGGGAATCASDCTINLGGCADPYCGGIEGEWLCDDGSCISGESHLCNGRNDCPGGEDEDCPVCGDGTIEDGPAFFYMSWDEECDGTNFAGETCVGFGYSGGSLTCDADCRIDQSTCIQPVCGDGQIGPGERCDGSNLDGHSECGDLGFTGTGSLSCLSDCSWWDTSQCEQQIPM